MRHRISHGAEIEIPSLKEIAALIHDPPQVTRVRAPGNVALDGNGNGQGEIYKVPMGMEFAARRVFIDISTASDPSTGAVPLSGTSVRKVVQVPNPAAGVNWVATVPAGKQWTLLGASAVFTASAAAANRFLELVITVAGVPMFVNQSSLAVTAGQVRTIVYQPGSVLNTNFAVGASIPIPFQFNGVLNAGDLIASATGGLDAGDQYSAINVLVLETSLSSLQYLRSGTRIEYGVPIGPNGSAQIPGVQSWGDQQGPTLRNGEVFEIKAAGLTANASLVATVEGILRTPGKDGLG